jgi:UDP-2,4-diacetamido-2,4,6-trideoxy-beta-L-altropyranose hydrolase
VSHGPDSLRVFILTHGGRGIGFGHVTRCMSLFRAFQRRGVNPVLILDVDDTVDQLLSSFPYEKIAWMNSDGKILNRINSADVVVIDSFMAPEFLYPRLADVARVPVYIDDYVRRTYSRGVVVDWTILAERKFFKSKRPEIEYLLGSRYAALRREFWTARKNLIRQKAKSVLISFGGSDTAGMTPKVLRFLNKYHPSLIKRVVIGPGFRNAEQITAQANPHVEFVLAPDAKTMKATMQVSDLAISAGGQTLYELARLGVPTIGVQVTDNQHDDIAGWSEVGFLEYAGTASRANLQDRLQQSVVMFLSYEERLRRSQTGRNFVDGAGAIRIVDAILTTHHACI